MHEPVCQWVDAVGGGALSGPGDCDVYAVDLGELVLVDCGVGPGWDAIAANLRSAGHDPSAIHTLLLTHCHVDHIGAADRVVAASGCRVVAHAEDVPAIESGDARRTAADWYGVTLPGVAVDTVLDGDAALELSRGTLKVLHTPGHTPGSVAAVVDSPDGTVLFGQDIHGPFSDAFGSDKALWRRSMERLLAEEADILCEGHYGVIRPASEVRAFIEGQIAHHCRAL